MFLERVRQIHIGPSLVYPAVGAVPHIAIDYTATSDSYLTFATAHLIPATEARESALHMPSWKEQTLVSSLNSKPRAVPPRIGTHIFCGRRRARRYSLGSCLCCTSMISKAPRVNDRSRLAGAEAALCRFGEDYLGEQSALTMEIGAER